MEDGVDGGRSESLASYLYVPLPWTTFCCSGAAANAESTGPDSAGSARKILDHLGYVNI